MVRTRLGLIAIVVLVVAPSSNSELTICSKDRLKIDCLPGNAKPTEADCAERECCWQQDATDGVPQCSYPVNYPGYTVTTLHPSSRVVEAVLQQRAKSSPFPNNVQTLVMSVQYLNKDILHVKIKDSQNDRFEPPLPEIDLSTITRTDQEPSYSVKILPEPASIKVTRKTTGEAVFDTSVGSLIFADQYLQLSTSLPTPNIYGIGEHHDWFNRGQRGNTYTIFNRGELVPSEKTGFNLYGSHPLFLSLDKLGHAHGVFLLNSNAMDVVVQPENPSVTYRTIGGVLDFYIFLGPSPDEVVQQYTSLVGRPFLVPYWTLGFQLCRYKYDTTQETKETWLRNKNIGIPLDTMWNDIDYMDNSKDFTLAPTRMDGLKAFVEEMHDEGVHYIMNNSPGLSGVEPEGTYPPLDEAKKLDILIKDYQGNILEANVWQNITYMVDFSNPKTQDYWEKNFKQFYDNVLFDGAWIDMNEPYSFTSGSLKGCPSDNPLDHPPYVPGGQDLYNGTICMSAQQHLSTHYNIHSLYAIMETIATNKALTKILGGKRPFVLSRASSPGFGFWGAHWSGDVHSSWEHLRYSIPNMLNFNMYGIPMIGTDICGFVGNTTQELCTRWMQLGSFYPFSRNHNDFDTILQDPAVWDTATQAIMKASVETRYYLLPFFYTLMVRSHLQGTPAVRPLFFDFPSDTETYGNDRQFLWGNALMVIPVLEEGATKVTGYLPASVWYDYYTGQAYSSDKGQNVTFEAPIDHINVLLREGYVVPAQEFATTTSKSRHNPFNLRVTLNKEGKAVGELYWDDGDSIDSVTGKKYNQIKFQVENNNLLIRPETSGYSTKMDVSKVKVYGVMSEVQKVTVAGTDVTTFTYDDKLKVLEITGLSIPLLTEASIIWS